MEIEIINNKISQEKLKKITEINYGHMTKGVVDIRKNILALGGELHADAEAVLLERGSKQQDLWGANYYPDRSPGDRIEYVSFINIRPSARNFAMEVMDAGLREKIKDLVGKLLP